MKNKKFQSEEELEKYLEDLFLEMVEMSDDEIEDEPEDIIFKYILETFDSMKKDINKIKLKNFFD